MITNGKWELYNGHDHKLGKYLILAPNSVNGKPNLVVARVSPNRTEEKYNAEFIVTCANQCQAVNKDHPEKVAENIKELHEAAKALKGALTAHHIYFDYIAEEQLNNATDHLESVLSNIEGKE